MKIYLITMIGYERYGGEIQTNISHPFTDRRQAITFYESAKERSLSAYQDDDRYEIENGFNSLTIRYKGTGPGEKATDVCEIRYFELETVTPTEND